MLPGLVVSQNVVTRKSESKKKSNWKGELLPGHSQHGQHSHRRVAVAVTAHSHSIQSQHTVTAYSHSTVTADMDESNGKGACCGT